MKYTCPLGNDPIFETCKACVKDHAGAGICGACEGVKKGQLAFTCKDCNHPECGFSGAKETLSCIECYQDIPSENDGVWVEVNGEDYLFCSHRCGETYGLRKRSTPR